MVLKLFGKAIAGIALGKVTYWGLDLAGLIYLIYGLDVAKVGTGALKAALAYYLEKLGYADLAHIIAISGASMIVIAVAKAVGINPSELVARVEQELKAEASETQAAEPKFIVS